LRGPAVLSGGIATVLLWGKKPNEVPSRPNTHMADLCCVGPPIVLRQGPLR